MRPIAVGLAVCAVLSALDALAKGPPSREVEVTGSVEVTNLPAPSRPARFQLVGFTTTAQRGDAGVLAFTLACQAELPGSRMCSSVEVMETVELPTLVGVPAWVRPVLVPGAVQTAGPGVQTDASGVESRNQQLSCDGWSFIGGFTPNFGLTVSAEGRFRAMQCDGLRPVSCCALVVPQD